MMIFDQPQKQYQTIFDQFIQPNKNSNFQNSELLLDHNENTLVKSESFSIFENDFKKSETYSNFDNNQPQRLQTMSQAVLNPEFNFENNQFKNSFATVKTN